MCVDATQYHVRRPGDQRQPRAPARGGLVTGTARPVHIGGRTQVWSIEIVNDAGATGLHFAAHHGRHQARRRLEE